MFCAYFSAHFFVKVKKKSWKNKYFIKIDFWAIGNHIFSTYTKFEVRAIYRLGEKKSTKRNILWTFSMFRLRISVRIYHLRWGFPDFTKKLPSSPRHIFFHRSRSPMMLYVFEKYFSRSLDCRCLFDEMRNLTPPKIGWKFIDFQKNPKSRFAQPHLKW